MTQLFTHPTAAITGSSNLMVLAELARLVDFDKLQVIQPNLAVTKQQVEEFQNDVLAMLLGAGMLDEELNHTGQIRVPLK